MKKVSVLLLLMALGLLWSSCEKEDETTLKETIALGEVSIYEVKRVDISSMSMTMSSYVGSMIGSDIQVELTKGSDGWYLMVPYVESGKYQLKYDLEDSKALTLVLDVKEKLVQDADSYIASYKTEASSRYREQEVLLDSMLLRTPSMNTAAFQRDRQRVSQKYQDYLQALNTMSSASKDSLAQYLESNKDWLSKGSELQSQLLSEYVRTGSPCDVYKTDYDTAFNNKEYLKANWASVSLVGCAAKRWLSKTEVVKDIQEFTDKSKVVLNTVTDSANVNTTQWGPMTVLNEVWSYMTSLGEQIEEKPVAKDIPNQESNIVEFENDTYGSFQIEVEYRKVEENETGSSYASDLSTNYKASKEYLSRVNMMFPEPLEMEINFSRGSVVYAQNQGMSISNIIGDVSYLGKRQVGDVVELKFETSSNVDQNFSFELSYSDGYQELNKRVDAVLKVCSAWSGPGFITDCRDGEEYQVVTIGSQRWMSENLRYAASGSWLNPSNPSSKYGRLYDWSTVMAGSSSSASVPSGVQGICPTGWHVPSDEEWKILEKSLGMSQADVDNTGWRGTDQGTQMKSTSGWTNNGNGSNSSGFNAFPAGLYDSGSFDGLGNYALFWSSTEYSSSYAWFRNLDYGGSEVSRYNYVETNGFSCRCVEN